MEKKTIALRYLECLEKGDTTGVLALFAPAAKVQSPLYGQLPASEFYPRLAADTRESRLVFQELYVAGEAANRVALAFDYHWILQRGKEVHFRVVDLIEFNEANQIVFLHIIYDTVESRRLWNEQQG